MYILVAVEIGTTQKGMQKTLTHILGLCVRARSLPNDNLWLFQALNIHAAIIVTTFYSLSAEILSLILLQSGVKMQNKTKNEAETHKSSQFLNKESHLVNSCRSQWLFKLLANCENRSCENDYPRARGTHDESYNCCKITANFNIFQHSIANSERIK